MTGGRLKKSLQSVIRLLRPNGHHATSVMHGEDAHDHHVDHNPLPHASIMKLGPPSEVDTPSICFWFVVLVGFTVFTERSLHALQHRLGKRSSPGNQMMYKVKDELMLMGLLSFCLNIVGEAVEIEHKDKLPFEWAHTLLFMSALVLVLLAVALICIAHAVYRQMHAMENTDTRHLLQLARSGQLMSRAGHRRVWRQQQQQQQQHWVDLRRAAQFQATRRAFLREHHLPLVGFDFPEYLHRNINYVVLEVSVAESSFA